MNRRPISQQRYAIRRLGVATVLAVGVFGAVKGVSSLTEDKVAGEAPTTTSPVGDGSVALVADPTTTTVPPPPPTERTGPPTADNPAQVLVMGDSDAGTFAPYLDQAVADWGVVDVETDYKVSSGLARPDFYNWPEHLRQVLAGSNPDIIVVTFGGNDAQGLFDANGDVLVGQASADNVDEWTTEYANRVQGIVDIMLEGHPDRTIIWVGIPNAQKQEFTDRLYIQDQAVRQALQDYPDVMFIDTWEIFDGVNGGIAEYVVDPRDGEAKPVRQSDGFHLNEDGAGILADKISDRIRTALEALGAEF